MNKYINQDNLAEFARHSTTGLDANDIMRFPAADVVEVKHGKWIDEEVDCGGIYGGIATQVITYCSECEEQCEYRTYFCPNCGADMRGETE